jgi:hypothetical protein
VRSSEPSTARHRPCRHHIRAAPYVKVGNLRELGYLKMADEIHDIADNGTAYVYNGSVAK